MRPRSLPTAPLLAAALLAAGCSQNGKTPTRRSKPPPMVRVATARVTALTDRLELTGTVEPTRIARMASPLGGPVIACPVREGDRVRPGQVLARLGRAKGDDAVATSARAELEKEQLELSRIEKLVKTGALPGEELDRARVKVSASGARLARAMERLSDYRIIAPWGGTVSRVHVAVGDFVAARSTLVEMFDPKSLVLRFAVPEDRAARVQDGAPIQVRLDAHPGQTLQAQVSRIYPEIDRRTHTRTVEGTVATDLALTPGMFARLALTLASVKGAVAVPVEAVLRAEGQQPAVFVVTQQQAQRRAVTTGIEEGGLVQIESGVAAGEQVAVAGHTRLRDGARVRLARRKAGGKGKAGEAGGKAGAGRSKATDAP